MSQASSKYKARQRYKLASRLEMEYLKSLRAIVKNIDHMTKSMINENMSESELKVAQSSLSKMLNDYGNTIEPWAKANAQKMLNKVAKADEADWVQLGRQIGSELKKELQTAPTGDLLKKFLGEQVSLITSLPIEASNRVHEMTLKGITTGERANSIAAKILETGDVTLSRAKCIARTEVARTASGLTMARSKHIGVTHYYWRTSADGSVRESHKHMNGKICEWNAPPEVEPGMHYHAGMIYNCRCYPEPILDHNKAN
jgi:SPP1 gp7 family putative phage head morphogenesis protein